MNRSLETFQNALKTRGLPPSEAYCRLVVTRGSGRIGFSRSAVQTPTFWCTITQKVATPGPEDFERGLKLALVERERNSPRALTPEAKSGNYLNSVLAFLEAENFHAADDAIFCDSEGFLTEGTTFNLFYVRRGKVATPPVEVGILRGITRNHVLRLAKKEGLDTREVRFTPEHLLEADEVFVTSSIREVLPVSRVYLPKMFQTVSLREGWHPIQKGRPGPVTRRLARLFREAIPEWLGEN
jgi:branched-chain amino acid aminotransferase